MRDHNQLRAFRLADEVALLTYAATGNFPDNERFGLVSQMRRAAVSVPSNIVEGCARDSQADYHRFLGIAFGSLRELHYQLSLAERLDYLAEAAAKKLEQKISETEKVLNSLIRSMKVHNHI